MKLFRKFTAIITAGAMLTQSLVGCVPRPPSFAQFYGDSENAASESSEYTVSTDDKGEYDAGDTDKETYLPAKVSVYDHATTTIENNETFIEFSDPSSYNGNYSVGEKKTSEPEIAGGLTAESINGSDAGVPDASLGEGAGTANNYGSGEYSDDAVSKPKGIPPSVREKSRPSQPSNANQADREKRSLEEIVIGERALFQEKSEGIAAGYSSRVTSLNGNINSLASIHNETIRDILATIPALTKSVVPPSSYDQAPPEMERSYDYLRFASRNVQSPYDRDLVTLADTTLQHAQGRLLAGDANGARARMATANALSTAVLNPWLRPNGGDTAKAFNTGVDLVEASNELDAVGLSPLGTQGHLTAGQFLSLGLSLTRFSQIVDIPMSLTEAFTGTTLDFDDFGSPILRNTSNLERGLAIGIVALTGVSFVAGGWYIALGTGAIAGITKVLSKVIGKKSGIETAERITADLVRTGEEIVDSAGKIGIAGKDLAGVTKEVDHLVKGKVLDIYEAAAKNKPLGLGSTGRSVPNDLKEQAAMLVTRADPQAGKPLERIIMSDPRWLGTDGWQKWQTTFKVSDGRNITIHYVRNVNTGLVDDFKFVNYLMQ